MGKFNFSDLMSDLSKGEASKQEEKKEKIVYIDLYNLRPMTENFYDVSKLQDLISTIPLVGVLQPLLVKPNEDEAGAYDIIAGERRWTASKHIVEEMHRDDLRNLPCIIKESDDEENDSDVMNGLALIFSNRYREVTDYEKMIEVVKLEQLIDLAAEKKSVRDVLKQFVGTDGAKKEEQLTALTGLKHTQLCRHRKIYNNLCERLMRGYEKNAFQISVAYEAAGLSPEYQEKAADKFEELGTLSLPYVQMLKEDENKSKPIPGQQSLVEQPKTETSYHALLENKLNRVRMMKLFHEAAMIEDSKIIDDIEKQKNDLNDLKKDGIIRARLPITTQTCILATSREKYGYEIIDTVKNDILFFSVYDFWDTYKNLFIRAQESEMPIPVRVGQTQEEKTEEQETVEEDLNIREVSEPDEVEEKEEETVTEEEPETVTEDAVKVATSLLTIGSVEFSKIRMGMQKFLLVEDIGFKRSDIVELEETAQGNITGRTVSVVVEDVIKDRQGLETGYCILTFNRKY